MKRLMLLIAAGISCVQAVGWASEPFGTHLGTSRGVKAYSNGSSAALCSPSPPTCPLSEDPTHCCQHLLDEYYSYRWQCVEYVRRWWIDNLGALVPQGNACAQWDATSYKRVSDDTWFNFGTEGQGRYTNGSSTVAPQAGDLLVYRDNSGNCNNNEPGHVGIIHEVNLDLMRVYVAEQNVSNNSWGAAPYARVSNLTKNGSGQYSIVALGGYTVRGWRRSSFLCEYVDQSPSGWTWVKPGNTYDFQVRYRNKGIARWFNGNDLNNIHNVELWSCDASGTVVDSWLEPVNWISGSRRRATSADEANRSYNDVATFTFQARIAPSAVNGDYPTYFRPTFGGLQMEDDWGGMYFPLRVDADAPTAFSASASPTTSNVNSFSFSWTASSDERSGLKRYLWSVNGGTETAVPATTTSLASGAYATQEGNNTFVVVAEDNVGNRRSAPPVTFTLTSSPCPGRQIPNTCVPSTQCYPTASNLQMVPDLTAKQWMAVGQPVRDLLKPGTFSVGFEYRSSSESNLRLGFANSTPSSDLGAVVATSTLPAAPGDWKSFWSAPFTVTGEQLRDFPNLRFVSDVSDGIEIGNVRIWSRKP